MLLVCCSQCTMIYADPVPEAFASGTYYQDAGMDYYLTPAKLQSDYSTVRFERELALFRRRCLSGRVLDVGCSSGAFLFQLTRRFPGSYQVLGTDVSGPPLDYAASRGVPVLRGDFLTHDFGVNRFDAVTFWAVLEHLVEPRAFLRKVWGILEAGGLCIALVPNMKSLAARFLGMRYRYIYPQHLNYFTRATLTRLASERFEIVESRSMHFNPIVIWQDWRRGGAEVSNSQRAQLLQRTTSYKQNRWLKPLKGLYRVTERLLGLLTLADNVALVLRKKG
jgi:2-polyprenyl-3-methyl-5-hydroxy-6-metoxy-1,4-benzoquinol methylase